MGKEIVTQVLEVHRVPYKINPCRNMPRHILIKLKKIKYKEKILKAENNIQGNPIMLSADFSSETLQARGSGKIYFFNISFFLYIFL